MSSLTNRSKATAPSKKKDKRVKDKKFNYIGLNSILEHKESSSESDEDYIPSSDSEGETQMSSFQSSDTPARNLRNRRNRRNKAWPGDANRIDVTGWSNAEINAHFNGTPLTQEELREGMNDLLALRAEQARVAAKSVKEELDESGMKEEEEEEEGIESVKMEEEEEEERDESGMREEREEEERDESGMREEREEEVRNESGMREEREEEVRNESVKMEEEEEEERDESGMREEREEEERDESVKMEEEEDESGMKEEEEDEVSIDSASERSERGEEVFAELTSIVTGRSPTETYEVEHVLGKGSYGTVFHAKQIGSRQEQIVAVKKIAYVHFTDKKCIDSLAMEVKVMKTHSHPNIVSYLDSYLYKGELWIVMEYMDGGSLSDLINGRAISDSHTSYVIKECLQALLYLHRQNIIHRDFKPDNVMLSKKGVIKLTDMGLCGELKEECRKKTTFCGTPRYMALEIFREQPYDNKVDIWSIGVTTAACVDKEKFIVTSLSKGVFGLDRSDQRITKIFRGRDGHLKNFIGCALKKDPEERWSAAQLLEHPYIGLASPPPLSTLADLIEKVRAKRR